jgi:predicted nucleotidyltransferase
VEIKKMESRTASSALASSRQTELGEAFNNALFLALDAIEERHIPYGLIGGVAASGLGRPRSTHDIDIFIRPEDAEVTIDSLLNRGFETERTDPRWLFKAWKNQILVDIIFKSQGDIYFDQEMQTRTQPLQYHGRKISVVSPEDLIIIKCAVHSEIGPHHWHDALAVLSHAELDWTYLIKRARRAPRRLLALLIYAQSNDLLIPNWAIAELYQIIFSDKSSHSPTKDETKDEIKNTISVKVRERPPASYSAFTTNPASGQSGPPSYSAASNATSKVLIPEYVIGHINESLAADPRTATLDIQLAVGHNTILVKGSAYGAEQKDAIETVIRENHPEFSIDNQIQLTEFTSTYGAEAVL